MKEVEKVASFNVDHTRLKPGLYVSRVDYVGRSPVTTFDLRMVPPNSECQRPLPTAAMHTIEHFGATFLRDNSEWSKRVIYFGPMGCRTGFYLVLSGELTPNAVVFPKARFATVRELVLGLCWLIMRCTDAKIPGATPKECGNYLDHNIPAAREAAHNYYMLLAQSPEELGYDQFTYPK